MRTLPFLVFLPFLGCGTPAAQSATVARNSAPAPGDAARATGDRTHFDGADLSVDLPGHWEEAPVEIGHDLRKGPPDPEEVVIVLMPRAPDQDEESSTSRLANAQRHGMSTLCKRGAVASSPTRSATMSGALHVHVICDEPRVLATYTALTVEGEVLSFEHYWYAVPGYSEALDHADEAILASLQVHALRAACPGPVVDQITSKGGTCLEAAVLGQAAVETCGRALASRGWTRDEAAAEAIGRQTEKVLVCYRRAR
jgi:hypothetical protein